MNYTGHLAFGLEAYKYLDKHIKNKKDFLTGCVALDAAYSSKYTKCQAHFRDKSNTFYRAPDISIFLEHYLDRLQEDFVLGLFCHLFADNVFSLKYMPYVALPLDADRKPHNAKDAKYIKLRKENKIVSIDEYNDAREIYNDYTITNKDLIETFNIKTNYTFSTKDPCLDLIESSKLLTLDSEVFKFCKIITGVDTKVIDTQDYILFIKKEAKNFAMLYEKIKANKM